MCRPNGLVFPAEILRHGSHFAKKSLDMGPDFQNLRKILLNQPFLRQKTLRNGSQFSKFSKKRSNQPFFEREKSLDMGRGFGGRAAHPRQNIIRVPPRESQVYHEYNVN